MTKKVKNQVKVIDKDGRECQVDSIDITELGYLKVKCYYPSEGVWRSYFWTDGVEKIMNGCELKLIEAETI